MSRRRILLLALVASSFAVAAGARVGRWPARSTSANHQAELVIEPQDLDLGEVWETDRFIQKVTIHNHSPEPVRVTTLGSSCSCVTPGSVSETIGPGQLREVPVELDLRLAGTFEQPREIHNVKFPLPLRIDPPRAGPPWVLSGRIRSAITLPIREVDLGRTPVDAPPRPRTIPIRVLTFLSQFVASVDNPAVVARLSSTDRPREWELVIGPASGLSVGRYSATVTLHPVLPSGAPVPPVRVPVAFDLLADVQPDTGVVVYGPQSLGKVIEERITLTSLSGSPFRVDEWVVERPADTTIDRTNHVGPSQTFVCRQHVRAAGHQATRVIFRGSEAGGKPFTVTVEFRYHGLAGS